MASTTYGDKPISFQVDDGGEYYCIGSEVNRFFINTHLIFLYVFIIVKIVK